MKNRLRRLTAIILSLAVLASVWIMLDVNASEKIPIENYPALKGFTSGNAPDTSYWSYGIADYGAKSPLTESDDDFAAPKAEWDSGNGQAKLSWSPVEGAAGYTVNFYLDSALALSKTVTDTFYTSALSGEIEAGKYYEIQILALDSENNPFAASRVRRLPTIEGANSLRDIENFDNASDDISDLEYYSNTSVTGAGAFRISAKSKRTAAQYISAAFKADSKDETGFAQAIVVKASHAVGTVASVSVEFGVSAATTGAVTGKSYKKASTSGNWQTAGNASDITFVSAADTTKSFTANVVPKNGYTNDKEIAEKLNEYAAGYYIIIPLSAYDEDIAADIKAGTFDRVRFKLQRGYTTDSDNVFSNTGFTKNDSYTDIDQIAYCDGIEDFLSELVNGYDSSYSYTSESVKEVYSTVYNPSSDTMSMAETGAKYIFTNKNTSREVKFLSVSTEYSNRYGTYMSFTAQKDGLYDLTSALTVTDNTAATGEVYYRLVKISDKGETHTRVYPFGENSDWYTLNVTEDKPNPAAELGHPSVELVKGDKLVIEAYFEPQSGSSLTLSLGNPTVTAVQRTDNYKGIWTDWFFGNYAPHYVYDGTLSAACGMYGRWDAQAVYLNSSAIVEKTELTQYNSLTGFVSSSGGAGYYYYTASDRTEDMKLKLGGNSGVGFNFVSPVNGELVLSMEYTADSNVKYRIADAGGNTVYPAGGNWQISNQGENSIYVSLDVLQGERLSLQFISEAEELTEYSVAKAPVFSRALVGSTANAMTDTTYAPLWERPWKGREYEGEFTEYAGALWDFNMIETNEYAQRFTSYNADTYSTADNKLYSAASSYDNNYYVFADSALEFNFASPETGYAGMELIFNVPSDDFYDISTGIRVLKGEGLVYLKVLKNGSSIYGQADWQISTVKAGSAIDFNTIEVSAEAGDKITFQIYTRSSLAGEEMRLAFDSFAIQRLDSSTQTFLASIYNVLDYKVIEPDYTGDIITADARYNFSSVTSDGVESPVVKIDSAEQAYITADGTVFGFANNIFTASPAEGGTAAVTFNAASSGGIIANIIPKGNAQIRLICNGEELTEWVSEIKNVNAVAEQGDAYTVEIKGTDVEFSAFGFELIARASQGTEVSKEYYAVFADPYRSAYGDYVGEYVEDALSYWRFYLYETSTDKLVKTEWYNSEEHKLQVSETNTNGYKFTDSYLYTDISREYGLSLGFTAPRSDVFNFRTALKLDTPDAAATVKARLVSVAAKDGTVTAVWPADGGWEEKAMVSGEEFIIPYTEFTIAKGNDIRFEVMVEEGSAEQLRFNLISPSIVQDTVSSVSHSEFVARVFDAYSYNPYKSFKSYTGSYIPMENRWNFEFFKANAAENEEAVFLPHEYSTGEAQTLSDTSHEAVSKYSFAAEGLTVDVALDSETQDNTGAYIRYVSSIDGLITVKGAPTLTSVMPVTKSGVGFRVRKIDTEGKSEQLWPADGSEWEKLTNLNSASLLQDFTVEVTVGDQIVFELCVYADDEAALKTYLETENEGSVPKGLTATLSYNPQIVAYDYLDDGKSNWNGVGGFVPETQVNPFWKVQSTYNWSEDNVKWQNCTRYTWNYWLCNDVAYIGIAPDGKLWLQNYVQKDETGMDYGGLDAYPNAAVCYAYYPQKDGFITIGNTNVTYQLNTEKGRIRITLNGEDLTGWRDVPVTSAFKGMEIEVKKGDILRFEMSSSAELEHNINLYVKWNPSFVFGDVASYYNTSDDIYNMLDDDMLAFFKKLTAISSFDEDPEAGKALSEEIAARKKKSLADGEAARLAAQKDDGDASQSNSSKAPAYIPGTYEEWTEEIYTPGGGYRRIVKTYYTEWWVYALIIAGAVLGVAAVVIIIILVRKKRKKSKGEINTSPKKIGGN